MTVFEQASELVAAAPVSFHDAVLPTLPNIGVRSRA